MNWLAPGGFHFEALTGGRVNAIELIAALINQKDSFEEGLKHVQEVVEGTASILVMTEDTIYACRDRLGRLPIHLGKDEDGFALALEFVLVPKTRLLRCSRTGSGRSCGSEGHRL